MKFIHGDTKIYKALTDVYKDDNTLYTCWLLKFIPAAVGLHIAGY